MVTDRYAHIIDADRKVIAEKMEARFVSCTKTSDEKQAVQSEVSSEDQELKYVCLMRESNAVHCVPWRGGLIATAPYTLSARIYAIRFIIGDTSFLYD